MKTEELINALEEQEKTLKEFLECGINKQKSIINNDLEKLHSSLISEEKLLTDIESNGMKISYVISILAKEYSIELSSNSLSELLNSMNSSMEINVKVVNLLQNSIKDLIIRTSRINQQNKVLIDHSRSFLRETISTLIGLSKGPLLDRKI